MIKVVAFTSPFAHAGKHRQTRMFLSNIVDQFHDRNRLAHTSTAKQTDLAALRDRHNQVDYLDASFKNIDCGRLVRVSRGLAMNRQMLGAFDRACVVYRVTQHVHDPAQGFFAHRHRNGRPTIADFQPAFQTVT